MRGGCVHGMKYSNEIEPRLKLIHQQLLEIHHLYSDIIYCRNHFGYSGFEDNHKSSVIYPFLIRYFGLTWSMLVIKLSVIYDFNGDYSIQKCLRKLQNCYQGSDWKNRISKEEIKKLSEGFDKDEIKEALSCLKEIRDKHLAHIDLNRSDDALVTYEHVERLKQHATDVLNNLFQRLEDYNNDYATEYWSGIVGIIHLVDKASE